MYFSKLVDLLTFKIDFIINNRINSITGISDILINIHINLIKYKKNITLITIFKYKLLIKIIYNFYNCLQ